MNQRLVWNFEFAPKKKTLSEKIILNEVTENLKWEIRFFWPDSAPVVLHLIDECLLNITAYRQKYREDYYYLLPEKNFNIKRRSNQLLYKPLLKQSGQALAYGTKINISTSYDKIHKNYLEQSEVPLWEEISEKGVEVYVTKEAFIYKFPTTPTMKLELARIKVGNKFYMSACIEGKSLTLVKNITENLLSQEISCDYVHFLKNIVSL